MYRYVKFQSSEMAALSRNVPYENIIDELILGYFSSRNYVQSMECLLRESAHLTDLVEKQKAATNPNSPCVALTVGGYSGYSLMDIVASFVRVNASKFCL